MSATRSLYIRYAAAAGQLYISVDGHATHQASMAADRVVGGFLETNPPQPAIILDLEGCTWVDSTFAGWMFRLRQRLVAVAGHLVLSRCPEACRSSFDVMGLTSLFSFQAVTPPPELQRLACPQDEVDAETIQFMLDAHAGLAEVSPANAEVFGRIADQLRRELERRKD